MSLFGSVIAGCILAAGCAPVAEALRTPVVDARRRATDGVAHDLSDGVTWRRRKLGPDDGPVAILVHGLTTPSPVYDAIAEKLAGLGWHVLSYDLYGRGYSDRPNTDYDRALYLRQMIELLRAEGIDRPVLAVGYSMGGAIVTDFAIAHPDKVLGLCLVTPGGMGHAPDRLSAFAIRVPILGDWAMTLFGPRMLRRGAQGLRNAEGPVADIAAVMEAETKTRGYMRAVTSSLRLMLRPKQTAQHGMLNTRRLKVVAIWGAQDTVIPLSARDAMAAAHPNSQHVTIDRADHGLPFTHPQAVVDAIDDVFGQR